MLKVIDNFLPLQLQEDLKQTCLGMSFPWYYIPDVTRSVFVEGDYAQPGFHHTPFNEYKPQSQYFDYFKFLSFFIINEIKYEDPLHLFRIRAGLNVATADHNKLFDQEHNFPHIDHNPEIVDCKTFTCLYYVNDSDGDTFVFDQTQESDNYTIKKRVTPKQGRLFIFDGEQFHASSSPEKSSSRVVLTYNYHAKRVI
jgi:hypothetical protein